MKLKMLFAVKQIFGSVTIKGMVITTAVVYARVDKASFRTLLTIVVLREQVGYGEIPLRAHEKVSRLYCEKVLN